MGIVATQSGERTAFYVCEDCGHWVNRYPDACHCSCHDDATDLNNAFGTVARTKRATEKD